MEEERGKSAALPFELHQCVLGNKDDCQDIHDPVNALEVARERVDERIGNHAGHDAVRNRVAERHINDREERWDRLARVGPVDLGARGEHHVADDDQRRGRCEAGDCEEDRREEDREGEERRARHGREARAAARHHARGGLDVGRRRGRAEQRADRGRDRVRAQRARDARELAVLVEEAALHRDADQRPERVEEVDEEEREHDDEEVERLDERPARAGDRAMHLVRPGLRGEERADRLVELPEVLHETVERDVRIEREVAVRRIRHVDAHRLEEHAEHPRRENAEEDRALQVVHEQEGGDERAGAREDRADAVRRERDLRVVDHRDERRLVVDDDAGGLHRDEADEEADAGRDRALERERDRVEDRLAHGREREREEEETLDEHREQRELPAVAHVQDDRVGEERVEAHARRQHERIVRHECHEERANDRGEARRDKYAAPRDARVRQDVGVHSEDVRHRHERRNARDDFRLDG